MPTLAEIVALGQGDEDVIRGTYICSDHGIEIFRQSLFYCSTCQVKYQFPESDRELSESECESMEKKGFTPVCYRCFRDILQVEPFERSPARI